MSTFDMLNLEKMSSSLFESYLTIRPMFDLKPIEKLQSVADNMASSSSSKNIYNSTLPLYTHIFGFESLFESTEYANNKRQWLEDNWTLSIWISVVYVFLVFSGRWYMNSRPKFELRLPLILWNLFLASFSILGFVRVWPEFFNSIYEHNIEYSVCNNRYAYGITGFWAYMFVMSKLPELVDTLFIVLRKQQLILLHWYHHTTVLVYCWYSYKNFTASGRWFMTMNYFVHSMMYSYYALKAMRIRVPAFVSQIITTSQIAQMVAGCYVNWVAYQAKAAGQPCSISDSNVLSSSLMYLSYFVLFVNFFLNAYIFRSKSSQSRGAQSPNNASKSSNSNGLKTSSFQPTDLQNASKFSKKRD